MAESGARARASASGDVMRMARVMGELWLLGSLFLALSVVLDHPPKVNDAGIWSISAIAFFTGCGIVAASHRFNAAAIHALLTFASVLIGLLVYFSGIASGIYAVLYVWVVLVAARTFSLPGLIGQLAWIGATYAAALSAVDVDANEFATTSRWALTVAALCVTGVISWRLVAESREAAERSE